METPKKSDSLQNLNSPDGSTSLHVPSPIITRRTRTDSTSARAFSNPQEHGTVKSFSRSKGHGFIERDSNREITFVHISDIEGEYIPLPGDKVKFRLCPIPPKFEKYQAVHVEIVNFTPEVHVKWDSPDTPTEVNLSSTPGGLTDPEQTRVRPHPPLYTEEWGTL